MSTSVSAELPDARTESREARWRQEAAFFDREAERCDVKGLPIDPLALQRYMNPRARRRFSKEYAFKVLGPLEDRKVLDVGCGDGLNAVMFARMGARVTGLDISPGALDVARRRAEVNGVADRVRFVCAPVEKADLAPGSFDVVWGEGILHHVLDELDFVVGQLAACTRQDGLLLFTEPVNLNPTLRRLRGMLPARTDVTPGERPMERRELDVVRRHIPDLVFRYYSLLGRLDRFVLVDYNYERSPVSRRSIVNVVNSIDWFLLALPAFRNLASICVMHGRSRREAMAGQLVKEESA